MKISIRGGDRGRIDSRIRPTKGNISDEDDEHGAQCHIASHKVHEDGRQIESKPTQR